MRTFLSGNEEVAKFHLPVVQSMANEFAKNTENRGLKQNAFAVLFKDTGARAAVTYCFGEINVEIDAPFTGGVEQIVRIDTKDLYEWNKVADIDRVCRGDKGALLGMNQAFLCEFDAPVVVVLGGSISAADETIPESMRDGMSTHKMYSARRYIAHIQDAFFAWRYDYFSYSFADSTTPVYVASQGLFADSFTEYGYTQLFRMDELYVSGSPVMSGLLPSAKLNLTSDGTLIAYGTQDSRLATETTDLPEVSSSAHPGTNMFDPQESAFWPSGGGGAGGLWAGASEPIAAMRGDAVAYFSGETAQGDFVNQYSTYMPPYNTATDTYMKMYASTIDLNININFVDSNNQLQLSTFAVLTDHIITDPSYDANECVYYSQRVYSRLGEETTFTHPSIGTMIKTGNYAYTLPGAWINYIGPHVYVTLSGATPELDFFLRSGDSFIPYKLTNSTGYSLNGVPKFGFTADDTCLIKEIGIIESSHDGKSFVGMKYYEEKYDGTSIGVSHNIGIYEFVEDGLGGVSLVELILFVETGEAKTSNRKVYLWFSQNYDAIAIKGSAAHDGVWVKSGGAYTQIVTGFSGYTEPVYISKDGSVVALRDKIYVDGVLAVEPVECVGVFHTHDFFVDKISAAQFAIKDMEGNVVTSTPDGLYNFYELTEDSSYAVLSKTWWEETDDKATDVALVVGFADGPVKFETCDQYLVQQIDPSSPRISQRFDSTASYFWPTTWCRAYTPNITTAEAYSKQSSRVLVSCREDGFAERANNFAASERVSAFLWHPVLGLLQRLMNTVLEIPYDMLHQKKETVSELEE